jgi:hypothetical protein
MDIIPACKMTGRKSIHSLFQSPKSAADNDEHFAEKSLADDWSSQACVCGGFKITSK